ncbi:MAG: lytic transglycosylase domain-containing protein [Gammaproteobacteria bacterium]|nr:lytic transglycosylase domain-containing protein [Gammaproteobacteria bacterium]
MLRIAKTGLAGLGLAACLFAAAARAESGVKLYVYELLDGSRIVTGHALANKHYRLVRTGVDASGEGQFAASRNSQFFRTDPSAYDDVIRRVATAHQVDFALIKAVMHVESSFNPYARSRKGALGLMQVMPETAKRHGVHDIYDPMQNIEAGVKHLKYLTAKFNSEQYLVLAAYNAGENAVRQHNGIPPYEETQSYVRKVLSLKQQYSRS